jgi:ankyrin repeat protein
MSSFLISQFENLTKENLDIIANITDGKILNDLIKYVLSKENKEAILFLIENDKIPKSLSLNLFQFIAEKKYWDMFLILDYTKFDIHAGYDYAFRSCCSYGNMDIIKHLIQMGANIHADDDGALRSSSYSGKIEVIKFLVEMGADIHTDCDFPLRYACYNGHIEVVKYLVEKDAEPLSNGTAIKSSIIGGHIEIVKFLTENGANIYGFVDDILLWLSFRAHVDIFKFFLDRNLEYFLKYQIAKEIVIYHKLVEYYEKFDICIKENIILKTSQTKDDIMKYINSNDSVSLKNCNEFDFSMNDYYYFFKSLMINNIEINQIIFNFIENKEDLYDTFNKISLYFEKETKNKFNQLLKNSKIEVIKINLENLINEINDELI